MNSIDTKIRFLWLSDIHYKYEYGSSAGSEDLRKFLSSFHTYISEFEASDFDYILLSGDIAQEGSAEDYAQFCRDILDPLQAKFPEAQLLVVPGNHDVARKDAKFVKDFLASMSENNNQRLDFFGKDIKSFEKIFAHYTAAFKGNGKIPAQSSETYKGTLLYGHVLDVKRKVIFVLLNTSWYSLGNDFLKLHVSDQLLPKVAEGIAEAIVLTDGEAELLPDEKEEKAKKEFEEKVHKLIKEIPYIAEEYGKQLIGMDHLKDIKKISDLIDNYNDFLVVTVMHHPLNWLNWEERITTTGKFHDIRKQTDLLLTGHEHIPRIHRSERIHDMLHLQAGCFMHAAKRDKVYATPTIEDYIYTDENWFSTLEINIKKRTVKQIKHHYDIVERKWFRDAGYKAEKLNNKHFSTLSLSRRNGILNAIASESALLKALEAMYKGLKIINANLYLVEKKIIIFITDNQVTVDLMDLKANIALHKAEVVQFLFVDVVNPIHVFYLNEKDHKNEVKKMSDFDAVARRSGIERYKPMDRLVVLEAIKNDFDFKFDQCRYDFFKSLSQAEALSLKDLKFVSVIKPYWEFESILA